MPVTSEEVDNKSIKESMETGAAVLAVLDMYDKQKHEKLQQSNNEDEKRRGDMLEKLLEEIDPNSKHKDFVKIMMTVQDLGHIEQLQKMAGFSDFVHIRHDERLPKILDTLPAFVTDPITSQHKAALKELWKIGFLTAQYNQGEAPVSMLDELWKYYYLHKSDTAKMEHLRLYLFGLIFDIAGANSKVSISGGLQSQQFKPDLILKTIEWLKRLWEKLKTEAGKTMDTNSDMLRSFYTDMLLIKVTDAETKAAIEALDADLKLAVLRLLALNRFKIETKELVSELAAGLKNKPKLIRMYGEDGKITLYFSPKWVQQEMKQDNKSIERILNGLLNFFEQAEAKHAIVYNVLNNKEYIVDPKVARASLAMGEGKKLVENVVQEKARADEISSSTQQPAAGAAGDTVASSEQSTTRATKQVGCCLIQ